MRWSLPAARLLASAFVLTAGVATNARAAASPSAGPSADASATAPVRAAAVTATTVSDIWLAAASWEIRAQELRFSRGADGSFSALNRTQGLRVRVWGDVVEVSPRDEAGELWQLSLRLAGLGRGGALARPGA